MNDVSISGASANSGAGMSSLADGYYSQSAYFFVVWAERSRSPHRRRGGVVAVETVCPHGLTIGGLSAVEPWMECS